MKRLFRQAFFCLTIVPTLICVTGVLFWILIIVPIGRRLRKTVAAIQKPRHEVAVLLEVEKPEPISSNCLAQDFSDRRIYKKPTVNQNTHSMAVHVEFHRRRGASVAGRRRTSKGWR